MCAQKLGIFIGTLPETLPEEEQKYIAKNLVL